MSALPATLPPGLRLAVHADAAEYAADASGRRGASPLGVVRPRSVDEIEHLVRWANGAAVPLVPVSSRAGPRRRGDTVCPVPALVVELAPMNRVVHVDARDAVAVIEAGVTFAELDAALKPYGLKSFKPLLPRAGKSVLAAFLEREPITAPGQHWDAADPLAALELVFGSGDRFRTGGAALPGTWEDNLERGNRPLFNFGPGQTDFGRMVQGAQGSLAIVGRGSVLCARLPAASAAWFVSADTLAPVVAAAYAMLKKRPDGHLFLVNATQLARLLTADTAAHATLRARLPAWTLFIELSATAHFADEAMAYRRADLEAAAAAAGATLARELAGHPADALAARLERSVDLQQAHESVFFLGRLNHVQRQIDALAGLVDPAELAVYLQPVAQGVAAHCEFGFPGAAPAVARAAAERLAAVGAFFSRPYHPWADLAFANDPQIAGLLRQTKSIFDPRGVLQPQSQALGPGAPTA